ncbi:MAG: peptide chain release factor N(5)-glutamine methyltransferase [Planctomycetota bacterium]|nr:peptide chain release factor N(5)-glutamine methyltransferase [Planctomycetota bacterium]
MTQASSSSARDVWTTRRLLHWMGEAFTKANLDSPRLSAEILLAHVLDCDRLKLYVEADRPASPLEREALRELVKRALTHEPVQYLVSEAWFFGLRFHVDRRVLIPRPATETIVEHVLQHARSVAGGATSGAGLLIADICTGSGCIAIALLKNLKEARGVATDISRDALEVARSNAERHGVLDRLDLLQGDLLQPLHDHPAYRGPGTCAYVVSNPPYIPDDEWDAVLPNVKDHEPHLALRGGVDGLDLVKRVIAESPHFLRPGGELLVEVADSRAKIAAELAGSTRDESAPMLSNVRVLADWEALPRVVVAARPPTG